MKRHAYYRCGICERNYVKFIQNLNWKNLKHYIRQAMNIQHNTEARLCDYRRSGKSNEYYTT